MLSSIHFKQLVSITFGTIAQHPIRPFIYSADVIYSWARALSPRGTLMTGSWLNWRNSDSTVTGARLFSTNQPSSAILLAMVTKLLRLLRLNPFEPPSLIAVRSADEECNSVSVTLNGERRNFLTATTWTRRWQRDRLLTFSVIYLPGDYCYSCSASD